MVRNICRQTLLFTILLSCSISTVFGQNLIRNGDFEWYDPNLSINDLTEICLTYYLGEYDNSSSPANPDQVITNSPSLSPYWKPNFHIPSLDYYWNPEWTTTRIGCKGWYMPTKGTADYNHKDAVSHPIPWQASVNPKSIKTIRETNDPSNTGMVGFVCKSDKPVTNGDETWFEYIQQTFTDQNDPNLPYKALDANTSYRLTFRLHGFKYIITTFTGIKEIGAFFSSTPFVRDQVAPLDPLSDNDLVGEIVYDINDTEYDSQNQWQDFKAFYTSPPNHERQAITIGYYGDERSWMHYMIDDVVLEVVDCDAELNKLQFTIPADKCEIEITYDQQASLVDPEIGTHLWFIEVGKDPIIENMVAEVAIADIDFQNGYTLSDLGTDLEHDKSYKIYLVARGTGNHHVFTNCFVPFDNDCGCCKNLELEKLPLSDPNLCPTSVCGGFELNIKNNGGIACTDIYQISYKHYINGSLQPANEQEIYTQGAFDLTNGYNLSNDIGPLCSDQNQMNEYEVRFRDINGELIDNSCTLLLQDCCLDCSFFGFDVQRLEKVLNTNEQKFNLNFTISEDANCPFKLRIYRRIGPVDQNGNISWQPDELVTTINGMDELNEFINQDNHDLVELNYEEVHVRYFFTLNGQYCSAESFHFGACNIELEDDQEICYGEPVRVLKYVSPDITEDDITWFPTLGLDFTDGKLNPVASPEATTTYRATIKGANGCFDSDEITITVNPLNKTTQSKIIEYTNTNPSGDQFNVCGVGNEIIDCSGYLITGTANRTGADGDFLAMKVGPDGTIIWAESFAANDGTNNYGFNIIHRATSLEDQNGNHIGWALIGESNDNNVTGPTRIGMTVFLNADGTLNSSFPVLSANATIGSGHEVLQLNDGSVIAIHNTSGASNENVLSKYVYNGSSFALNAQKIYTGKSSASHYSYYSGYATQDGNFLAVGSYIEDVNSQTISVMVITKFDSNLDVVWSREYNNSHAIGGAAPSKIIELQNQEVIVAARYGDAQVSGHCLIRLNNDASSILDLKVINGIASTYEITETEQNLLLNGSLVTTSNEYVLKIKKDLSAIVDTREDQNKYIDWVSDNVLRCGKEGYAQSGVGPNSESIVFILSKDFDDLDECTQSINLTTVDGNYDISTAIINEIPITPVSSPVAVETQVNIVQQILCPTNLETEYFCSGSEIDIEIVKVNTDPTKCCYDITFDQIGGKNPINANSVSISIIDEQGNSTAVTSHNFSNPGPVNETVNICVNSFTGVSILEFTFEDANGNLCTTQQEIKCNCDCDDLKSLQDGSFNIRLEPYDGGGLTSTNYRKSCCYEVYLDNNAECGFDNLIINGSFSADIGFSNYDNFTGSNGWTLGSETVSNGNNEIELVNNGNAIPPGTTNVHIGTICFDDSRATQETIEFRISDGTEFCTDVWEYNIDCTSNCCEGLELEIIEPGSTPCPGNPCKSFDLRLKDVGWENSCPVNIIDYIDLRKYVNDVEVDYVRYQSNSPGIPRDQNTGEIILGDLLLPYPTTCIYDTDEVVRFEVDLVDRVSITSEYTVCSFEIEVECDYIACCDNLEIIKTDPSYNCPVGTCESFGLMLNNIDEIDCEVYWIRAFAYDENDQLLGGITHFGPNEGPINLNQSFDILYDICLQPGESQRLVLDLLDEEGEILCTLEEIYECEVSCCEGLELVPFTPVLPSCPLGYCDAISFDIANAGWEFCTEIYHLDVSYSINGVGQYGQSILNNGNPFDFSIGYPLSGVLGNICLMPGDQLNLIVHFRDINGDIIDPGCDLVFDYTCPSQCCNNIDINLSPALIGACCWDYTVNYNTIDPQCDIQRVLIQDAASIVQLSTPPGTGDLIPAFGQSCGTEIFCPSLNQIICQGPDIRFVFYDSNGDYVCDEVFNQGADCPPSKEGHNQDDNESRRLGLNVIPNPVTDQARFEFNTDQQTHTIVEIYDLHGQKVSTVYHGLSSEGPNSYSFSTSSLSTGTYLIKLNLDGSIYSYQFIKE